MASVHTMVTIQVDFPRGVGLGGGGGGGGNVRQVKRHVFLVRPRILRQLLVFITRENASFTPLARLITRNLD